MRPVFLRIVADHVRAAGFSAAEVEHHLEDNAGELARLATDAAPAWTAPSTFTPVPAPTDARHNSASLLPLDAYDRVIVGFSGGKDSVACLLTLCDQFAALGIDPREPVELWHHVVDGRPGVDPTVFDWAESTRLAGGGRVVDQAKREAARARDEAERLLQRSMTGRSLRREQTGSRAAKILAVVEHNDGFSDTIWRHAERYPVHRHPVYDRHTLS